MRSSRQVGSAALSPWPRAIVLTVLALPFLGCSPSGALLNPREARVALTTALDAWKAGKKPDALASSPNALTAVDAQWQAGQVLEDYLVDGDGVEEASLPGPAFAVKLRVKGVSAEVKTRYIVFGREPTWVYREDDWTRLLNMDNNPRPPGSRGRP